MTRILVVDDEPMVCAHLTAILSTSPDLDVVEQAHDGAAAVDAVRRCHPDVVLMDLRMPGIDGITAIERIRALPDGPVIVALTTFDEDRYVMRALRAGADGFLVKSTPPEDFIDLLRVAAQGNMVLSPTAAHRLLAASTSDQDARDRARSRLDELSKRELEVLSCIGEGATNAQIASRLYLSEATIKGYVSQLLVKLDCANRTQASLVARDAGL